MYNGCTSWPRIAGGRVGASCETDSDVHEGAPFSQVDVLWYEWTDKDRIRTGKTPLTQACLARMTEWASTPCHFRTKGGDLRGQAAWKIPIFRITVESSPFCARVLQRETVIAGRMRRNEVAVDLEP